MLTKGRTHPAKWGSGWEVLRNAHAFIVLETRTSPPLVLPGKLQRQQYTQGLCAAPDRACQRRQLRLRAPQPRRVLGPTAPTCGMGLSAPVHASPESCTAWWSPAPSPTLEAAMQVTRAVLHESCLARHTDPPEGSSGWRKRTACCE